MINEAKFYYSTFPSRVDKKKNGSGAFCQQQNFTRIKLGLGTFQLFLLPGM